MGDKEMLELAAKAVNGGAWHPLTHERPWNPLIDDGDAFRLTSDCLVNVNYGIGFVVAKAPQGHSATELFQFDDKIGRMMSTRRAITRAAASIGKAQKDGE